MVELNGKYWDLIAKHLQGEASKQEEADLFAWANEKPENQALFNKAKSAWKITGNIESEDLYTPDVDKGWKQFQFKAGLSQQPETGTLKKEQVQQVGKTVHFGNTWATFMKIAAVFLVLIGLVYVVKMNMEDTASMLAFQTEGEKRTMYLPDSSLITLNKHSTLSYASDFNENERVVYLQGEAFFDVKKTNGKTFTIISADSKTQVLGTSFTVRSYENEGKTEVQVLTGKVAFSTKKNPEQNQVLLTPGYKAVMEEDNQIVKAAINDPNFMAWKNDKLEFNNTRMDQVIATLEKYFEVPIEITEPQMLKCRFTGTFEKPTLQEIVDVLVVSVDLTYARKGNQFIFSGRGCN
jgi:ferric-dicitrate binding protein FerR (iron transport regulator)